MIPMGQNVAMQWWSQVKAALLLCLPQIHKYTFSCIMMMLVWNVGNVDLCWTKAFTDSCLDVHAFCTSHFHLNANPFRVPLIIDQRVDRERGISWELIHPSKSGSSVGEALAAETSPLRLHPPFLPLPHSRPPATSPLGLMHHLMAHFHLRCTINRASYHFKAYTCNISPRLPSICKGTAKYSGTGNCGGGIWGMIKSDSTETIKVKEN